MTARQRLEKDFADLLRSEKKEGWWWYKFQTNALSHLAGPADFLVLTPDKNVLVECKECRQKVFKLDRLTQMESLLSFEKTLPSRNKSFVVFVFWGGSKKNSDYFVVGIQTFINKILATKWKKRSINQNEFNSLFCLEKCLYEDITKNF